MSKQCPSKTARDTKPVGRAEIQNFWSKRLFKNTYTREGRRVKLAGWSIKIQHLGRRHTFSLATLDRAAAAIEAKAIYDTIATEGWDVAFDHEKNQVGFPRADTRFWKQELLVRRYHFPASGEPEKSFTARIGHAGSAFFFPLGTDDPGEAAKVACRIYCTIVRRGWEAAAKLFPRELIVAFEWYANPIMWTYTTVHTLVGRLAHVDARSEPTSADLPRVLIVETDTGLRRALAWCINRQSGFSAVVCAAPESFASAFAANKPRLVLLNRNLAEHMGIEFSGELTPLRSGALALAYSVFVDGDHMFVSTPGGAEGYMLKRVPSTSVIDPMLLIGSLPGGGAEDHLTPVKLFSRACCVPVPGSTPTRWPSSRRGKTRYCSC